MNDAQPERREWQSVRAVSRALVPNARLGDAQHRADHAHLLDRVTAITVVIDDAITAFSAAPSRSNALSLVLVTGFCWQVLRAVGGKAGNDAAWIEAALPQDHEASDAETGDTHFARQIEISDNDTEAKHKRLLAIIRDGGRQSRSDITRRSQFLSRREREEIVASLIEAGLVIMEVEPGTTKPTAYYTATTPTGAALVRHSEP